MVRTSMKQPSTPSTIFVSCYTKDFALLEIKKKKKKHELDKLHGPSIDHSPAGGGAVEPYGPFLLFFWHVRAFLGCFRGCCVTMIQLSGLCEAQNRGTEEALSYSVVWPVHLGGLAGPAGMTWVGGGVGCAAADLGGPTL